MQSNVPQAFRGTRPRRLNLSPSQHKPPTSPPLFLHLNPIALSTLWRTQKCPVAYYLHHMHADATSTSQ